MEYFKNKRNLTKQGITSKHFLLQIKKSWFISIFTTFCSVVLLTSTFLIVLVMERAFNVVKFDPNLPEQSIVVDMNKVDIQASDKSLRLLYFEEKVINQSFQELLTNVLVSQSILPSAQDKYDFTFYRQDGSEDIDNSLVQTDGLVICNLKIKLKKSTAEFRTSIIAKITNTSKFYEKFMEFNHFDSSYLEHQNGLNPAQPLETERSFNGYLSRYYNYWEGVALDNKTVYDTIQEQIASFMKDYQQEFAPNTQIIPILSAQPLGELDINNPNSFINFFALVSNPNINYFGNDGVGKPEEYFNLEKYTIFFSALKLSPFYISYVSNNRLIDDLIISPPATKEELVDYFTNNSVEFMPFSEVQSGVSTTDNLEKYTPEHVLTFQYPFGYFPGVNPLTHFKFLELISFFANAPSITNRVEKIPARLEKINNLDFYLQPKIWDEISEFLLNHDYYFDLKYPDVNVPTQNWDDVTKPGGLYTYFEQYLLTADLITIQYLDSNHQVLNLLTTDNIDRDKIKNINFNIGSDKVVTNGQLFIPPHSFSFFLKPRWL